MAIGPMVTTASIRPNVKAPKKISAPMAAGAMTAKYISSSVQAIGWNTATTTATSVNPTMITRNGMLPRPWPSGTLMAR